MSKMNYSKEEKDAIIAKIQRYFVDKLDQEIGSFDAEFLLDFFYEELGTYFYNQGLYDAQVILRSRMDTITEAIAEIEKPTKTSFGSK